MDKLQEWASSMLSMSDGVLKTASPTLTILIAMAAVLITVAGYTWWQDPHRKERAVAKSLERKTVADVLSAALQDAAHNGQIRPEVWHKYNKKVAVWFNLPDMLPKAPKPVWLVKKQITDRLLKAGIEAQEALRNIKWRKPEPKQNHTKKDQLKTFYKS